MIEELVAANRILAHAGVVDAFGHVSARDPDDPTRFLMSRSLSPELVTAADIRTLRLDGTPVEEHSPYLERFIHAAIYAARPDVAALTIGDDAVGLSAGEIEAASSFAPDAPSSRRAWEYWCSKAGIA